jgi:uncharacterized membrane protein/thiol-disulfide isomerase/thioredoxin
MKRFLYLSVLLLLVAVARPFTAVAQTTSTPIVQVVLFYSPSCPHCHDVINNILPPLAEQYGDQLQVLGIDTSQPVGQTLYQSTIEHFAIPRERVGVPTLMVGEVILVGSGEIPEMLPGLVEEGLAAGGIGWPDIPGLATAVPDLPPAANAPIETEPLQPTAATPPPMITAPALEGAVLAEDALAASEPTGSGLALGWLVMLGMVVALVYGVWRSLKARPYIPARLADPEERLVTSWAVPALVVVGLGVALYLAYVETTHVAAVCGPVGDCNLVQSSVYAKIFGIPVAILGLLNYVAIGVAWVWQRPLNEKFHNLGALSLLVLTLVGILFSLYLTFIELLVLHAVCAWCLASAVVATLLFVIVVNALTKQPALETAVSLP